ncbi:MAG: HEAT repeat domain-containing protein [Thermoanaerobaculia bacterium]|nr:HEAT repeat domain-containing protein [Thermoanaerobaculia bacterium]
MNALQRRARRQTVRIALSIALAGTCFAASVAPAEDRLNVLLLDYHEPIEHDVLLSHLCVEPCTRSNGCPDELVRQGVDYWNDDFAVFRPGYLGSDASFVVGIYKDRQIDFLSISGHHASGFSGDFGKGRFYLDELAYVLSGLPGKDAFFATPSFVLLQGCWTDVKSGFDGDPIEYVRHIIEDTTVRAGESERLLAAIQQMAGEDDAYRELFPNACILGYDGTQVPGGLLEIYGQVNNFLRGLRGHLDGGEPPGARFAVVEARRNGTMDALNRQVDRECLPSGWPCNLCRSDSSYRALADALVEVLRGERRRLAQGEPRTEASSLSMESAFESVSLYNNSSWACSTVEPSTPPVYPMPIDRGPFLETFLQLLMVDLGQIRGDARHRIEAELVHLLGSTELDPDTRTRLRRRLTEGGGVIWREHFMSQTLPELSTFRQRDFFDFLAEVSCASCFEGLFSADPSHRAERVIRENAASQLRPDLGRDLYERALTDPSPRVRWLAATRLAPSLGPEVLDLARQDPDERVREAVHTALAAANPADDPMEDGVPPTSDEGSHSPSSDGLISTMDFEDEVDS